VKPTIPLVPNGDGYSVVIDGVTYHTLPYTPTSLAGGQLTVASHGTAEQLPDQDCKAVTIRALPTNTGYIYLGDATVDATHGLVLSPGDGQDIALDNLNRLYIDSDVDGEGISYLWVM
jgi:hypothetical protein